MTKPGHNSGDMSEADRKVLFFINRKSYLKAKEAQQLANAEMKRVGKVIKADLGTNGLDQIKAYEKAQTAEGLAEIKAKQEAERQALMFAGVPINTQLDIFEDRAPLDEKAFRDGEESGLRGDFLQNPYNEASPEGQAFAKGWHQGQSALFAGIKKKEVEAEELIKAQREDEGGDLDQEDEAA